MQSYQKQNTLLNEMFKIFGNPWSIRRRQLRQIRGYNLGNDTKHVVWKRIQSFHYTAAYHAIEYTAHFKSKCFKDKTIQAGLINTPHGSRKWLKYAINGRKSSYHILNQQMCLTLNGATWCTACFAGFSCDCIGIDPAISWIKLMKEA